MKPKVIKISCLFVLFFLSISIIRAENTKDNLSQYSNKFLDIMKITKEYHIDSLDFEKLTDKVLDFMLKEIDKDSHYYSSDEYTAIKNKRLGRKHGIGLGLININDTAVVFSVNKLISKSDYTILPGDRLLFVDGKNVCGKNIKHIHEYINGKLGVEIKIIFKSFIGNRLEEETFLRMETPNPSIDLSYIIENTNIGYLKLNRFSFKSGEEYIEIMDSLVDSGMKSLILDLRNNPGGAYKDARDVTASFLKKGMNFTSTQARNKHFKFNFETIEDGKYSDLPIVILMNKKSASASEVLAGTLQDFDRCIIVGERSYGKGTIQKTWEFKDSSAFKLTVGNYITPLGRNIHKKKYDVKLAPAAEFNMNDTIQNKLIDKINQYGGSRLPVFTTKAGKTVLGGGGIWVDYNVNADTTTKLVHFLKKQQIFNEYVYIYIRANYDNLNKYYGLNHNKYISSFNVNDKMLLDLKKLSYSKNIWNDEMFLKDKDYIKNYLKALIANAYWNKEVADMVLNQNDRILSEALNRIKEAKKLIK